MVIVLNGYPGVGKLTIGRTLAELLQGKLLDIHTVYNLSFALTEFRSPLFWDTVGRVEQIAHELIVNLPSEVPVVFTTVLTNTTEREQTEWAKLIGLGRARTPFCVAHISCDLEENIRRITSPGRDSSRKPRDPEMARRNQDRAKPLAAEEADHLLDLDTTGMTADAAAQAIFDWVRTL